MIVHFCVEASWVCFIRINIYNKASTWKISLFACYGCKLVDFFTRGELNPINIRFVEILINHTIQVAVLMVTHN